MKTLWKSALAAGVVAASLSSAAYAEEEEKGFYVGGNAFYTQIFDGDYDAADSAGGGGLGGILDMLLGGGGATTSFDASYDDDIGYGLTLGYKFAGPLRAEFEYRFQENDFDAIDDTLEATSMMGNLWYDFNMEEALRPYVGFGAGVADIETSFGDDSVMIGQLGAGVSWFLNPRLALDIGYRYAVAEDPKYQNGGNRIEGEYEGQSVMAGVRYNFFDAKYGVQDEDGDGVPDESDQCPGTPKGVQVDSVGCPLDGDNDGVADYLDQCPNTPAGAKVDEVGCSIDSDNDGVADADDMCPNTPAGQPVMSNGCAEKQSVVLRGVNFELDSAKLTNNAETILDGVATTLSDSPGFNVELQGHTDSTGSDSYNMNLSQNRAQSVKNFLVDKGVSSGRLTAKGYGETQPIASNETRAGRAENRRVELKVIGQDSGEMMEEEVYIPASSEAESDDPYDFMPAEEEVEEEAPAEEVMEEEVMEEESTEESSYDDYMTEESSYEDDASYEYEAEEEAPAVDEDSAEEEPAVDDYDYEYMP
ncbi:OmpA family protein [Spongiibacter taiwanensis]|uniref:OmpA family protein n=1 Tax=Spongiibacter taiwanensis TaxID=1748242 RepID=UPI00203555DC|nr:OmpA family protein [Spongiibacter taiwanensis]USA41897.1 OmpA family protein [Spongiibacter taiwanensis]